MEYGVPSGDASKVLASASPLVDSSSSSGGSSACASRGRAGFEPALVVEDGDGPGDVDRARVMLRPFR